MKNALLVFIIVTLITLMFNIADRMDKELKEKQVKFQDCMSEIHNVKACEEWTK